MDREFENAAKCWLAQCGADIKSKIENLLDENDSNPVELAEEINVAEEDIYAILEGDVENISVDTLIRVFMVLGLAVEVKPIEQTPLGGYDNVNPHVMHEPHFERRAPQPNPFTCQHGMARNPQMPFPPHFASDEEEEMERPVDRMGRGMNPQMPFLGHFEHRQAPQRPSSPFAMMSRDELTKIIRKKLWDSEIDLNSASNKELVRFLEAKDKRMKEFARKDNAEEFERDPQVADFVKRMKKNIKDNPQFRSYMKNFLNKLDEE